MIERELKLLLTHYEYRYLLQLFERRCDKRVIQTNYYYDTKTQAVRKANTTVRIREKNGRLKGTVKTHLKTDHCSRETSFQVDALPRVMMLDTVPVWLMGSLKTERMIYHVSEGITLMLDQNQYLETVDFELEIEYSITHQKQAEGILLLIGKLLEKDVCIASTSKSERFFKRLEEKDKQ